MSLSFELPAIDHFTFDVLILTGNKSITFNKKHVYGSYPV